MVKNTSRRWLKAFSKSLIAVFMVQLVLSAVCVTTAEAMPEAAMNHVSMQHCHDMDMSAMPADNVQHMKACTHCDTPDSVMVTPSFSMADHAAVAMLLVVVMPDVLPALSNAFVPLDVSVSAPPDSASLLYQTSRRILI